MTFWLNFKELIDRILFGDQLQRLYESQVAKIIFEVGFSYHMGKYQFRFKERKFTFWNSTVCHVTGHNFQRIGPKWLIFGKPDRMKIIFQVNIIYEMANCVTIHMKFNTSICILFVNALCLVPVCISKCRQVNTGYCYTRLRSTRYNPHGMSWERCQPKTW